MPHSVASIVEAEISRTGNASAITPSQTTEMIIRFRVPLSDITDTTNPAISVEITSERGPDQGSHFTKIGSENVSSTKTLSQAIGTLISFPAFGATAHNIDESFPVSKEDVDGSNSWNNGPQVSPNHVQPTAALPADLDVALIARATQRNNESGLSTAKDGRHIGDGTKQKVNSIPPPPPSLRPKITPLAKHPKRGSLKPSRYFFPLNKFTSVPPTTYSQPPRIFDAISGFSSSLYPTSYVRTRIGGDTSDDGASDSEQDFPTSQPVFPQCGAATPGLYSSSTPPSDLGQLETLVSQGPIGAALRNDAQMTSRAVTGSAMAVGTKHDIVDQRIILACQGPKQGAETISQKLGTSSASGAPNRSVASKARAPRTRASKNISSDKKDTHGSESQVSATQTQLSSGAKESTSNGGKDCAPRRSSRLAGGPYKRYK